MPYPENGQLVTKAFISGRRDLPHIIYRFLLHASIENKTRTHDSMKNKTSTENVENHTHTIWSQIV